MSTLRFKRYSKPHVLKDIGRHLMGKLFAKFKDDLTKSRSHYETQRRLASWTRWAPTCWVGRLWPC